MSQQSPKLRKATKTNPLYLLNSFPTGFAKSLAEHICCHLATREDGDLEGKDWEKIFADCIGANWTPSNVGLDDITHLSSSTAWGAKTVKGKVLSTSEAAICTQSIRLISGRNSPNYSFDEAIDPKKTDANVVGKMVLDIWNARVREVRAKFQNLRTVVLVKGENLLSAVVFEYETDMYISKDFNWKWNARGNLEGFDGSGNHKFTWQPHGSQFTVIETIPSTALRLKFKKPNSISKQKLLTLIGFDSTFFSKI